MNKNLIYSYKGFMLAILFIAAIKFLSFTYSLYHPAKSVISQNSSQSQTPYFAKINERGKQLFQDSCAACHAFLKHDGDGERLAPIKERLRNPDVLYEYIRNSQKVIESGDPYFSKLYKEYNKVQMKSFPNLTNKDIDDILEYINQLYENKNH